MSIYTKKGDKGTTSTISDKNVTKSDVLAQTLGCIDELNACIGSARSSITSETAEYQRVQEIFYQIQHVLLEIGSEIAGSDLQLEPQMATYMEQIIDHYQAQLPELNNFVVPGDSFPSAQTHIARTVCRRTERTIVELHALSPINENILQFINRLSDLLFVLARQLVQLENKKETKWISSEKTTF